MTIVCGTDFSEAALDAAGVAGAWARNTRQTVILVHAVPPFASDPFAGEDLFGRILESASRSLDTVAAGLRSKGVDVETRAMVGSADHCIVEAAGSSDASMIVVGSARHRQGTHWLVGSTTERLAATTPVPLIVVRDAESLNRWISGERPLHAMVASDFDGAASSAAQWASGLSLTGECAWSVAHVSWPSEEHEKLGIGGPVLRERLHPVLAEVVDRELSRTARRIASESVRRHHSWTLGRIADELSELAHREKVDLLVLGRARSTSERPHLGSILHGVVHTAVMNLACVPEQTTSVLASAPDIGVVLAATDLSETGDHAVRWAFSVAPAEARVIVLHAIAREDAHEVRKAEGPVARAAADHLETLIPVTRRDSVTVEVLEGISAAATICAAAERAGADLVCLGTHGRTGFRASVIGSVSMRVLSRSERPVLLVPPD